MRRRRLPGAAAEAGALLAVSAPSAESRAPDGPQPPGAAVPDRLSPGRSPGAARLHAPRTASLGAPPVQVAQLDERRAGRASGAAATASPAAEDGGATGGDSAGRPGGAGQSQTRVRPQGLPGGSHSCGEPELRLDQRRLSVRDGASAAAGAGPPRAPPAV